MEENKNDGSRSLAAYVGERIRSRRQRLGLGIREAAEKAGVTPALLGRIERGTADVRLSTLGRVQDALGLELFIVAAGKYSEITVLDEAALREVSVSGMVDGVNIFGEKVKGVSEGSSQQA